MKKLFYIVLVIVILMVIGRFVKQEAPAPVSEPTEVIAVEEAAPDAVATEELAVDENGNVIAEEEVVTDGSAEDVEEAVSPEAANAPEESHPEAVPAGEVPSPAEQ